MIADSPVDIMVMDPVHTVQKQIIIPLVRVDLSSSLTVVSGYFVREDTYSALPTAVSFL